MASLSSFAAVASSLFILAVVSDARADGGDPPTSEAPLERIWTNAEIGASRVYLGNDTSLATTTSNGAMLGVGAGARFAPWTFGARFRAHPQSAFTFFQLNAEVGLHPAQGAWDPYVNLHGGYVTTSLNTSTAPEGFPNPRGFDLGLSAGADYRLSPLFSLGFDATADVFLIARTFPAPGVVHTDVVGDNKTGGYALIAAAHATLHFDL